VSARRRHHEEEHEEHENHERWLITYADMITLLMVLFIVLFSISQVDLAKFEKFKAGLSEFGNGDSSLVELHAGGLLSEPQLERLTKAEQALADQEGQQSAAAKEAATLQQVQQSITAGLEKAGLGGAVRFRTDPRGLVVTVVTDRVLFDPGSDTLTGDGRSIVEVIASALAPLPNALSVEGHTDSVPISTARFPSNWELSTARATTVLRALLDGHGIAAARLSAAGYGDQQPLQSNATAAGRSANRRVEIVVHSSTANQEGTA
jgi:chemotaxis protein MotB